MTEKQKMILAYAKAHPEVLNHGEIAAAVGAGRTTVQRTMCAYMPDRGKVTPGSKGTGPTEEDQKTILEYQAANPELTRQELAIALNLPFNRVKVVLKESGVSTKAARYKKRDTPKYTLRPCLGEDCDRMHKSKWEGDRLCPRCRARRYVTYSPSFTVSLPGHIG